MEKTCKNCTTECTHAGKPNPWMQPSACVSHPGNKPKEPAKPRSGYQPVDDDDPFAHLQHIHGEIKEGDMFWRKDGAHVRIDWLRDDGWISVAQWVPGESSEEDAHLASIPIAVFCEELLRHGMVRKC